MGVLPVTTAVFGAQTKLPDESTPTSRTYKPCHTIIIYCIDVDGHYYTVHSVKREKRFMQKYTTVTASNTRRQAPDERCGRMCLLSRPRSTGNCRERILSAPAQVAAHSAYPKPKTQDIYTPRHQ